MYGEAAASVAATESKQPTKGEKSMSSNPVTGKDKSVSWENLHLLNDRSVTTAKAAYAYATAGIPVFPIAGIVPRDGGEGWRCACSKRECSDQGSPGKHPLVKWSRDATTDLGTVIDWWRRWPEASIGVPTGAPSGWCVLDLDVSDYVDEHTGEIITVNGRDELNAYLLRVSEDKGVPALDLDDISGLSQRTGSGGLQIVLSGWNATEKHLQAPSLAGWLPEVDIRGRGGYVIVPPSAHYIGGPHSYQWVTYGPPTDTDAIGNGILREPLMWAKQGSGLPEGATSNLLHMSQAGKLYVPEAVKRGFQVRMSQDGNGSGLAPAFDYELAKQEGPPRGARDAFFNAYAFELRKKDTTRSKTERLLRVCWEKAERDMTGDVFPWATVMEKIRRVWDSVQPDNTENREENSYYTQLTDDQKEWINEQQRRMESRSVRSGIPKHDSGHATSTPERREHAGTNEGASLLRKDEAEPVAKQAAGQGVPEGNPALAEELAELGSLAFGSGGGTTGSSSHSGSSGSSASSGSVSGSNSVGSADGTGARVGSVPHGSSTVSDDPAGTLEGSQEEGEQQLKDSTHRYAELNHTGLVHRYARMFAGQFMYVQNAGWHIWNGNRWKPDAQGYTLHATEYLLDAIQEEMTSVPEDDRKKYQAFYNQAANSNIQKSIWNKAAHHPLMNTLLSDCDANPWDLVIKGGTIDLKTGQFRRSNPADLYTKQADVNYVPGAECPLWEKHVRRITSDANGMEDPEMYSYVQRWFGYTLTGLTTEQQFLFAHGDGANGKNVTIDTLAGILGDYAKWSTPKLISSGDGAHETMIAELAGSRMVFVDEAPHSKLSEARIKSLVGSKKINAHFMRQDYFEFEPSFKLWLAGNRKPRVSDSSHGIWRRLALMPFDATIAEDERINGLDDLLKEEWSGILNWALEGLKAWREGQGLAKPGRVKEAVEEYKDSEDDIAQFVAECFSDDLEDTAWTSNAAIINVYETWAAANGFSMRKQRSLLAELKRFGFKRNPQGQRITLNTYPPSRVQIRGWDGPKLTVRPELHHMWEDMYPIEY